MWSTQPVKFGLFHIIVIIIALIAVAFGIYFGHCLCGEAYEKKKRSYSDNLWLLTFCARSIQGHLHHLCRCC